MPVTPETYNAVMLCYGYRCYLCCGSERVELHHRMPKSKVNQKLYPLLIHSPVNLYPLCRSCHVGRKHEVAMSHTEAEMYERFLMELKTYYA